MEHLEKNSQMHYWTRQKRKSINAGTKEIRRVFFGNPVSNDRNDDSNDSNQRPKTPKKKNWTDNKVLTIKENIDITKPLSLNDVRVHLSQKLLDSSPKQIYDKVQSLKRYTREVCSSDWSIMI